MSEIYRHSKIRIAKNDKICDMNKKKLLEELLSDDCRKRLNGFVGRKVGDKKDVEEIVQDTLLAAYDSLPLFKGNSSLFTWVCAIARHEIADFYRKQKIKKVVFSKLPFLKNLVSEALGPELAYQELEKKRQILKALKNLREGYGKILRLKYIDGLSMKEIAERLDITVKAVESRLTRARLAFQKAYESDEEQIKKVWKDWDSFRN